MEGIHQTIFLVNENKCLLCMNIGQLNDANTMIRKLSIVALFYNGMILRTFAARCETALESRNLCGMGYPEKPKKYPDFAVS